MAYYSVELTASDNIKIASTGNIIDSKDVGENQSQYSLVSGPSRDFVLVLG